MCDTGGFLPQKLFKDSSPRKRLYFFFIRRLWLAACSFSSLISPYSSQLNSYSQHCSLNNVKGCAILIAHLLHLLGDTHATREAWLCYHEEVPSCVWSGSEGRCCSARTASGRDQGGIGLVVHKCNVGLACFPVHYLSCLVCFPVHRWINLVVHRCDLSNFMSLLACKKLAIDGWGLSTYPSQKV